MDFKILTKLLFLSLITVVLFSCGTSSNGIFEKRKHLKGWHFKKNKKFDLGEAENKDKKSFRSQNTYTEHEENLALRIERVEEIEINKIGKPKQNEVEVIAEALNPDILKLVHEKSIMDIELDNTKDKFSNNRSYLAKKDAEVSQRKRHPIVIVLGILVFTYFLLMGLGIAMALGFLPAVFGGWFALGIPIWLISGYVVFAFYLYLIAKLFEREDGTGSLTLKQAFKKVIWPYVIFLVAIMALLLSINWSIY